MLAVSPPPPYDLWEGAYPPSYRLRFGGQSEAYFCFLLEGAISEGTSTYSSGKMIFFPAGRNHVVEIVQHCRCFIVRVGPDLLSRLKMNPPGSSEAISLGTWEACWLARRLYAEFLECAPAGALRIEAIILQLLALAGRSGRQKRAGHESIWLRRVREVIDGHYLNEYRLSELAAVAGVHRVHLVREFRKYYGTTIGEYMRKLRMDYASQLLGHTNLSLREIAAACRFADQSHFTKQFKKLSGLTPAEYRNLFQSARIESRPAGHNKQFGQDPHIGIGEASFVGADAEGQDSVQADAIGGSNLLPQSTL
jgi:AraC family transcriptional regulator